MCRCELVVSSLQPLWKYYVEEMIIRSPGLEISLIGDNMAGILISVFFLAYLFCLWVEGDLLCEVGWCVFIFFPFLPKTPCVVVENIGKH